MSVDEHIIEKQIINNMEEIIANLAYQLLRKSEFIVTPTLGCWFPYPNINMQRVLFLLSNEEKSKINNVNIENDNISMNIIITTNTGRYKLVFLFNSSDMYNILANSASRNCSVLLVDFSNLTLEYIIKNFKHLILYNKMNKYLIKVADFIHCINQFETNIKNYKITKRSVMSKVKKGSRYELSHVDQCPINIRSFCSSSYANVRTDCSKCVYFLYTNKDTVHCMAKHKYVLFKKNDSTLLIGAYNSIRKLSSISELNGIAFIINIYVTQLLKKVRSSLIFHEELKYLIMDLGKKLGFYSVVEKKCNYKSADNEKLKRGMIDVIWISNKFEVAFEIDSGFRKRSAFKLNKASFKYAFWIIPVSDYIIKFLHENKLAEKINLINIPKYRDLLSKKEKSHRDFKYDH